LTASLNWGAVADWDFHLQTPNAHVFFGNRSADGFTLDHDANPVCNPSGLPPEGITGNGQCGVYKLFSNLFSTCGGSPPITFSATVTALKPIVINGTALSVGKTFHPMDGVPFKVDSGSFTVTGKIPLPKPDNNPAGEFASGSPENAAQCNQPLARAYKTVGLAAAFFFVSQTALDAASLLLNFLGGTGMRVDFPDGSRLSNAVKTDPQFIAFDKVVQAAAAAQFNTGQTNANVTSNLKLPDFSKDSTEVSLFWAFGGTQGLDVEGKAFVQGSSYIGTITYTIRDIYGFTDKEKFRGMGPKMHYLQGICGAPDIPFGARFFEDSVIVTVPFNQPAP
jgi:hypothetical protein